MSDIYFYDCNCCIGKLKTPAGFIPTDTEAVAALLKKVNVKKAVTTHTAQLNLSARSGNERLASEIKNSDIFIPAVAVEPNSSDEFITLEELEKFIAENGVKMATMFPKSHVFSPAEWQMGETYSFLEEKNIPLLLSLTEVSADQIYEILSNHKSLKVIVKDTSFSNDKNLMRLMELFENFYLETGTYSTAGGISYVVKKFGAERILFGSGLHFSEPGASVCKVLCSEISDSDKIKIAHENLENMLKEVR